MALTYSPPGDVSLSLPDFRMHSVDGRIFTSADFQAPILVVCFICNHCPYVQAIESRFLKLSRYFDGKDVQWLGVCSNDPTDYPEDRPESLKAHWEKRNFGFPYLIDETQSFAKALGAVCTPEFYVFNQNRKLYYRGRLDDSWRDESQVSREDLKISIECLLHGQPLQFSPMPSMGCSIKWKTGV